MQNNFLKVEKPGKLANNLDGYKKKNKLDLPGLFCHLVVTVAPNPVRYWQSHILGLCENMRLLY